MNDNPELSEYKQPLDALVSRNNSITRQTMFMDKLKNSLSKDLANKIYINEYEKLKMRIMEERANEIQMKKILSKV